VYDLGASVQGSRFNSLVCRVLCLNLGVQSLGYRAKG